MKFGTPKLAEQCHVLCHQKLLHLRILFDGEVYGFDVHQIENTGWKLVSHSNPVAKLGIEEAKTLAERRARVACSSDDINFKWATPTSAPRPSGRVKLVVNE